MDKQERDTIRMALADRHRAERQRGIVTWGYAPFVFWLVAFMALLCSLVLNAAFAEWFAGGLMLASLALLCLALLPLLVPSRAQLFLTRSAFYVSGVFSAYPVPLRFIVEAREVQVSRGAAWVGLALTREGKAARIKMPVLFRVIELIGKISSGWQRRVMLVPVDCLSGSTEEIVSAIDEACFDLHGVFASEDE